MSGAEPGSAVRERPPFWSRALRIVAFAALAGPLIGGTVFLALALVAEAMTRGLTQADAITVFTLGPPVIALWGYALGLPPAAGAGLVFVVADAPSAAARAPVAARGGDRRGDDRRLFRAHDAPARE